MHKCFKFPSVVFLVLASLLQACGGGGGSSNNPSTQRSVVTNGVVTGFGSVVVDDNEIEDAKASVVTENADGTYSNTVLQLGQRIKVEHDGKGTANKVTVDATVVGAISAVSTTDLTVKVAGQVVSVNSDISKGPLTIWAGGYNSIADLRVDDLTQIHGSLVYDSVSEAYKITATRIQKMAALTSLKVSGKISDIDTTAKTFKLNELTVSYANAKVRPMVTNLANGMMVTAFAPVSSLSSNTLSPEYLKINRLQDAASQDVVAQISGQLSLFETGSKAFELHGMKVVFTDNTKITPSAEAISNSEYVTVSGSVNAEGVIQASTILVRQQSNSSDLAKVKLIGPISQFVDNTRFVVRGIPVDASFIDMTKACPNITLAADVPVKIDAFQQANTPVVLANRMECTSKPALAMRTLTGTLNTIDINARQFVMASEGASPTGSVGQQVLWNDKTTLMGMTPIDLKMSGMTFRVEGYMEAGRLIARVVSKVGAGLDDDKFLKPAQGNSSGWNDYQQGKDLSKWGTGQPLSLQFSEVPSAAYESDRLLNTPTTDFRVTGLYAPLGAMLTVNVTGQPASSSNLQLMVGTFSRYNISENKDPISYPLNPGTNVIQVSGIGGLVYIQYTVYGKPKPDNLHPLQITFQQGFVKTPHYLLGKTTKEDWKTQLSTYTSTRDVVMESKRAFMVFSRENALAWQDNDQDLVLNTADQILDAESAISGLDNSSETHRRNTNQFLMTQAEDGWMYATNFRTAYSAGAAKFAFTPLITGKGQDSEHAWGIWHELGHLHQQPWTWSELGEVTVNIYSLAAERYLLPSGRALQNSGFKSKVMAYLAGSDDNKNFNADSVDVFFRLYMFHQLWLAYGDNFYQQLHKITRVEKPELNTDAEKMKYFMLKACIISGKDLTGFFKKWGLQADTVYAEIAALRLSAPTTDPSTLTD